MAGIIVVAALVTAAFVAALVSLIRRAAAENRATREEWKKAMERPTGSRKENT